MAAASRPSDLLQAERRFGDELQRQQLTAQAKHSELEVQQTAICNMLLCLFAMPNAAACNVYAL
jgi:hypothetical protein